MSAIHWVECTLTVLSSNKNLNFCPKQTSLVILRPHQCEIHLKAGANFPECILYGEQPQFIIGDSPTALWWEHDRIETMHLKCANQMICKVCYTAQQKMMVTLKSTPWSIKKTKCSDIHVHWNWTTSPWVISMGPHFLGWTSPLSNIMARV